MCGASFFLPCLPPNLPATGRYWNQVNFKGGKQSFADGGGTDNLAVTPLLRRKVCRAVLCCVLRPCCGGALCACCSWPQTQCRTCSAWLACFPADTAMLHIVTLCVPTPVLTYAAAVPRRVVPCFMYRQIKYIVSCIAASEYLGSNTNVDDYAFSQWDISALFGAVPLKHKSMKGGKVNGMPPEVFNRVTQVGDSVTWCGVEWWVARSRAGELSVDSKGW